MSGLDLLTPQSALWYMLFVAVLTGAFLGVLCDGLFILRLLSGDPTAADTISPGSTEASASPVDSSRKRRWIYAVLRGLCDFLLTFSAAVTLMLLCYYTSDGQLRAPAVFGIIVGFGVYHKTVSRLLRRVMIALIGWIGRVLHAIWTHTLGRVLGALIHLITARARNITTARRIDRLTEEAARGFDISEEKTKH